MRPDEIVVVGAGPAGMRAAATLVGAGLRPTIIDEAARSGGQIYRRPHAGIRRSAADLYGFEANRAHAVHGAFDRLVGEIDYRPDTLVWAVGPGVLHTVSQGQLRRVSWRKLIIATGAMDRVIPFPGWTLPGVFTLGGAQTLLKSQASAIGKRVVFLGTGPLLYLVAYQYCRAGVEVCAVLDTSPAASARRALFGLARGGRTFLKGVYYLGYLRARGVKLVSGIRPLAAIANARDAVGAIVCADARGRETRIDCTAIGFGVGLRSETQLADLAGLEFAYDDMQRQWLPKDDGNGRGSIPGIYLACDGTRVRGADIAELTGERAARSLLLDLGDISQAEPLRKLGAAIDRAAPFRRALDEIAFPFPFELAGAVADEVIVCRCEAVCAGEIRAATGLGCRDISRVKAFTRLGMGRCQGRLCGAAAAEILAARLGVPLAEVGRLRHQAPIKPVPMSALIAEPAV